MIAGHLSFASPAIIVASRSAKLLLGELCAAYPAAKAGCDPASALPPSNLQHASLDAWEAEQVTGAKADSARAYWQQALAGTPAMLQLPSDRPRPMVRTFATDEVCSELGPALVEQLHAAAGQLGVGMGDVLLGAAQLLLVRYSGQDNIVVGVAEPACGQAGAEGIFGNQERLLPIRATPDEGANVANLVGAASEAVAAATAHALPFQQIVEVAGAASQPGVHPIFQVCNPPLVSVLLLVKSCNP